MNTVSDDFISRFRGMRWFGDIHGSPAIRQAVREALDDDLAIGFIGDLTDQHADDNGAPNDSADVIRLMIELNDAGVVTVSPGNHCSKLLRYLRAYLAGKKFEGKPSMGLQQTISEIMVSRDRDRLINGFVDIISGMPLWNRIGDYVFVHASAVPGMFYNQPTSFGEATKVKSGVLNRAIYGQTDGSWADGYPVRKYDWINDIPFGKTVVIGHDIRPEILTIEGTQGGRCIHIDTGAGKGGRLSWIDRTWSEMGL